MPGKVDINNTGPSVTILLNGHVGDISIGGNGQDGDLALFAADEPLASATGAIVLEQKTEATIHFRASDATIRAGGKGHAGGQGQNGRVLLLNAAGAATITVDGKAGDIILANADCAEDFDIAESEVVDPGTVMV